MDLPRHRAELRKHVKEARQLRDRLKQLKSMVEEHGDAPETENLRQQLSEAEQRLETVFLRQRWVILVNARGTDA